MSADDDLAARRLCKVWKHIEAAFIAVLLMPFALGAWLLMFWPGKGPFR